MSQLTSTSGLTSSLGTSNEAQPPWRPSMSSTTAPMRVSHEEGRWGGDTYQVAPSVTIPIPRSRGPGCHRRRDAKEGSGGHHQQLWADALPAAQGSSCLHPLQKPPLLEGPHPSQGFHPPLQEPHPARLSAESAAQRLARLDTRSPNVFENLDQLKSFFVEVRTTSAGPP